MLGQSTFKYPIKEALKLWSYHYDSKIINKMRIIYCKKVFQHTITHNYKSHIIYPIFLKHSIIL